MDTDIIVNFQVKSLHLSSNKRLRDENIEMFAKICPNLELLDLSSCKCVSNGAVEVLRRCPKIMYLSLIYHSKVELFGMINFHFPNLELLRLSYSEVDDGSLFII
ncbi:putative leucine-rich repeat domain, L domain-containing protein [Lupinus albus]|uniref:Putative leucine-rich repeat domain, L domain-containing protein n=1 Tax=Lupinus albus TaxID=3870 RepID=A0A6A4MT82_LUPAL|nr:putative leucine-rich repeat domain, L domain-containing protein [Lupinus albus]